MFLEADLEEKDAQEVGVDKTDEQLHQEDLERLEGFKMMDDTFARVYFKDNPELAEFVLKVITELEDLEIDEDMYKTQYDAKRLDSSRSLILDVYAGDRKKNRRINLEVEKWDASPERAEYHIATMCMENLHKNDPFSKLPVLYVIFICDHDLVGNGLAINEFSYRNDDNHLNEEQRKKLNEEHSSMGGRTHIIFVNGDYPDDGTEIGKLIHDFKCTNAKDMYFSNLADRVRYLKENPKGVAEMCKVMDDMRVETEDRTWITAIRNLMAKLKISVQEAMENLDVPTEKRDKYARLINMKAAS